jgi:hypothetical protein
VDSELLDAAVIACRSLISIRFPDASEHGAAAMVLGDSSIVTRTSPRVDNHTSTGSWSGAGQRGGTKTSTICPP